MRFLLVFYSPAIHEWRMLDTVKLPAGNLAGLPEALRGEPELMLSWLLGRYEIAGFTSARRGEVYRNIRTVPVEVYALDPQDPVVPSDGEYRGPWLEIFRETRSPVATLTLRKADATRLGSSLRLLDSRVKRPLDVSSEACRATARQLSDWQNWNIARDRGLAHVQGASKVPADQKDKV